VVLLIFGPLAFASSAQGLTNGRVCGFIRASIPYSRHGNAEGWRVYVAGATTCRAGGEALNAVMHMRAAIHMAPTDAHIYSIFGDWRCPAGRVGFQYCNIPASTPFRARALAVDCAENGCPSRRPPFYLFS
jgi:hypothetical protein